MDTGHWILKAIPKPVLTVDIVDFSLKSGRGQMKAIKALIEMLNKAIPEDQNNSAARIWSPAGDGGSITFLEDIHAALTTAISLGKLINEYNSRHSPAARFQLRMGLHSGSVTKEKDFDNRENVWGNGMNMSARVASLAKPGQILASKTFYVQADLANQPDLEATYIGKWWAKHNKTVELYNIHTERAGLPPSEVEEWFGPFHYPLQQAILTYEAMVKDQKDEKNAFRAAVLAKRLLDVVPEHRLAQEIIESISEETHRRFPGEPHLSHIFFSKLSPNTLLHFFQNAVFRTFEKGEYICKEGDKADSMMMVVSGQIVPLIGGQKLTDPQDPKREMILREGEIIGEMGLFNPGEKRTATLQTQKSVITLSIDYRFLRKVEGDEHENEKRIEIQEQIWHTYCARTIQNQINSHPLFRLLSDVERRKLIMNKKTVFLPPHYEKAIQLKPKDVWDHWVIVVAGNVTVYTADGHKAMYKSRDCLGPIRCVMRDRKEPVYTKVEVSPNAQLVRLPWEPIEGLMKTSEAFRLKCLNEGDKACQL